MKTLLFPLFVLMLSSCAYDPAPRILYIKNESTFDVYVYMTDADSIPPEPELKLIYERTGGRSPLYPDYFVERGHAGYLIMSSRTRRSFPFPGDTVRLFFIKKETTDKYSWEDIYTHQMYDKKVALTKKDMKRMNWLYIYNPDSIGK